MTPRGRRSDSGTTTRADKMAPVREHERLTISIYQNSEHVNGILQQAYNAPLLTAESRETLQERKDVVSTGHSSRLFQLPFMHEQLSSGALISGGRAFSE